jgi:hypothetical protein
MRHLLALAGGLLLTSCAGPPAVAADRPPPPAATTGAAADPGTSRARIVRLSGTLEAARSTRVAAPTLTGPAVRMTLTRLVPNGTHVTQGEIVAEFDPLEQLDAARESAARYDDLTFQVRQREADNAAGIERRRLDREQAEADLARALLEVSKASVVSRVEVEKNELRAATARARLESLARTQDDQERADLAALRILQLQRDRQRAANVRAQENLDQLRARAPITGTVALAISTSSGAIARPQVGDQMNRGAALLSIFDPGEMLVRVQAAEPDGALLRPGLEGTVYLDAYPDLAVRARLVAASPVAAASGLGRSLKSFMAVFRLEDTDPRLMPDLSAAVEFVADHRVEARPAADTGAAR